MSNNPTSPHPPSHPKNPILQSPRNNISAIPPILTSPNNNFTALHQYDSQYSQFVSSPSQYHGPRAVINSARQETKEQNNHNNHTIPVYDVNRIIQPSLSKAQSKQSLHNKKQYHSQQQHSLHSTRQSLTSLHSPVSSRLYHSASLQSLTSFHFTPYSPRSLAIPTLRPSPVISQWLTQLSWEQEDYSHAIQQWEKELDVVFNPIHSVTEKPKKLTLSNSTSSLSSTSILPIPSNVALCCDILDQVSTTLGRFAPIMRKIVHELFRAVYQGYDTSMFTTYENTLYEQSTGTTLPSTISDDWWCTASTSGSVGSLTPSYFFRHYTSTESNSLKAYFNVCTTLQDDYNRLSARIRAWMKKQEELQRQTLSRDRVLAAVVQRLQRPIIITSFLRWKHITETRNNQKRAIQSLRSRVQYHLGHMKLWFYTWRINAVKQKNKVSTTILEEMLMKSVQYENDVTKLTYEKTKEEKKLNELQEQQDALKTQTIIVQNKLLEKEQQLKALNGTQMQDICTAVIRVVIRQIECAWRELNEVRQLKLQDPTRLLISSSQQHNSHQHNNNNHFEFLSASYQHYTEGSHEWIIARREELKKARPKLMMMYDADIILLWLNFHCTQAARKIREGQQPAYMVNCTVEDLHWLTAFNSAENLERRADNFTTSLQDSELLLRLLGEIQPKVVELDMLMHIDLESRARRLLKMIGLFAQDTATLVSPLDLVHAFSPDKNAAMLSRLMMDYPTLHNTSQWLKPKREIHVDHEGRVLSEYGPFSEHMLAILSCKEELQRRSFCDVEKMQCILRDVNRDISQMRVVLEDAHERHNVWLELRSRCAAFVVHILSQQVRGEPIVMQDRQAIRQIRRYTKLLERDHTPQKRFLDLIAAINATSNTIKRTKREKRVDDDDDNNSDNSNSDNSDIDGSDSSSSDDDDDDDDDETIMENEEDEDGESTLTALERQQTAQRNAEERLRRKQERWTNQLTFELSKMQEMIARHYTSLRDIFRAYAQMDTGESRASVSLANTMSIHEFWSFIRDCRICNKHFPLRRVEKIFMHVLERDKKALSTKQDGTLKSNEKEKEIDARQFIEVLIRIAHHRIPSKKERIEILAELKRDAKEQEEKVSKGGLTVAEQHSIDALTRASISFGTAQHLNGLGTHNPLFEWGTVLLETTRLGLALRFYGLLRLKIIANAAKLNTDQFRTAYKRMDVSRIFRKYGTVLRKIFYKYACMHSIKLNRADGEVESSWTNTIDYKEFIQLLKDARLLDTKFLTLPAIYSIFTNVQQDSHVNPVGLIDAAKPETTRAPTLSRGKSKLPATMSSLSTTASSKSKFNKKGSKTGSTKNKRGSMEEIPKADDNKKDLKSSQSQKSLEAKGAEAEEVVAAAATEHELIYGQNVDQLAVVGNESSTELIYPEFLEAIAAVACFRHPNPYRSIAERLQTFLERELFPALPQNINH